uniref:Uncharacterized protein n=1 Tax=Globisporangium ultimum (strain ATCC 200006 / CBS 805.95 / DAOM BR144) TaxID=431595 RepID=K3WHD0_GLOUD
MLFAGGTAQKYFLEDATGLRALLNCTDRRRLPFSVKGTADLIIIDTQAKRARVFLTGLRFVIEVKKDTVSYDERLRWQLLLGLVVVDLKSERRGAPVGLLMDLNDNWYFL